MSSDARRVLAEAGAEQGAGAELGDHEILGFVGLHQHELRSRRLVRVGQVHDDAVVGPDGVGLEPEPSRMRAESASAHAACTRPP